MKSEFLIYNLVVGQITQDMLVPPATLLPQHLLNLANRKQMKYPDLFVSTAKQRVTLSDSNSNNLNLNLSLSLAKSTETFGDSRESCLFLHLQQKQGKEQCQMCHGETSQTSKAEFRAQAAERDEGDQKREDCSGFGGGSVLTTQQKRGLS